MTGDVEIRIRIPQIYFLRGGDPHVALFQMFERLKEMVMEDWSSRD